jgi:hypothetical protein
LANLKQFQCARYLRQMETGIVHIYTDVLAQRQDMEPCE